MSENPSEGGAAAGKPVLAGVIARWLGSFLVVAAIVAWLTGLPGTGLMMAAGGILLIAGMAFSLADRKALPTDAAAPPPSPLLAVLVLLMAVTAFLLGAGRTMGSAPSGSNDFLVEEIALVAALTLFLLAIVAFAAPRVRPLAALLSTATVGVLFLVSLALG
jgi:hypothetical protein